MTEKYRYDVVIIGAGPNGLAAAAYLSKAGAKVILLEKNYETGGGLATEDLTIPGFIHNAHSVYHLMVDYAPFYRDFELEKAWNIKYAYPELQFAMPLADGRCICIYQDVEKTCRSLAEFSRKDEDAWRAISRKSAEYMEFFLAPATYHPASPLLEQAALFEKSAFGRELMAFAERSPRQIIDSLFEDEHIKALMAYVVCYWGLDYDENGMGYMVLLLLNRATNYRLLIGGSHRIASVANKIINENGGQVRTSVLIRRIIIENGRATGVETDDGIVYEAEKAVVSSLDPYTTFNRLIDQKELKADFAQKIADWKWKKWSLLTLHLALEGRPEFGAAKNNPDVNRALVYVLGYESVDDLLKHWKAIGQGQLLPGAGLNCCFPSLHDPSQASAGRTSGLISQMAPYGLEGNPQKWYDRHLREEQTEQCLNLLERYVPGVKKQVLWPFVTTPIDIENKLNDMVEGSVKQGAYRWFQMGSNRPNDECSNHRTPIPGLYLCGACSYPGGLVTFGPGYLASNRIAEDAGFQKWWKEPEIVTRARQKGLL